MYLDDRNLLPVETVVSGGQDAYIIEKFLGVGLTSQVYRARQESMGRTVALKILRHDASAVSRDNFWHEAQVLSEIRSYGVTNVPEIMALQKEGDLQFLAMEYMDSQKYVPLTEYHEPFSEQEALEAAQQALRVLQVLHEKVGRTYTDMQLKNFLWNSAEQRLKILDWNHVSTQRDYIQAEELQFFGVATFEQLAQRDLARFGVYFYHMLTGKEAFEQGEPAFELERRAGDRWDRISVAARQIVCRALHPDPNRRYAAAAEFLKDVADLLERWRAPVGAEEAEAEGKALDDLLEKAKDARMEAKRMKEVLPEHRQVFACLDEVAARLDLLERQGYKFSGYPKRLQNFTQGVSAGWASGKLYYDAEQYAQALEIWKREAEAERRPDLWRWVLLAETGASDAEHFIPVREELEKVVKELGNHGFEKAAQVWHSLETANPWLAQEGASVRWLGEELQAAQQVAEGRSAEVEGDASQDPEAWERARKAFEAAAAALALIPYGQSLCETDDAWQGLETKIPQLEGRIAEYRQVNAQTAALARLLQTLPTAERSNWQAKLQWLLTVTPATREIQSLCESKAREWQEQDPALAVELVDTVLLYSQVEKRAKWLEFRQELQARVERRRDAEYRLKWLAATLEQQKWEDLQKAAGELPEAARALSAYAGVLEGIQRAYQERLEACDLEAVEKLSAGLTALTGPSEQRSQELETLRRTLFEKQMEQIKTAVEKSGWEEARLQARAVVAELPEALRSEPAYGELTSYVQGLYKQKLEQHLFGDAEQAHQLLAWLGVGDVEERHRELQNAMQSWQQQVEGLRTQQAELVQQIREDEQRRLEVKEARRREEERHQRLSGFGSQMKCRSEHWQELEQQGEESAYREVLGEVNAEIERGRIDYQDLSGEKLYQAWMTQLEDKKNWLEERLRDIAASRQRLAEAESQLTGACEKASKFTEEDLLAARQALQLAKAQLDYEPPLQDKKRHTDLRAKVLDLDRILGAMQEQHIVKAVQDTRQYIQDFQKQLDQKRPEDELLTTLGVLNLAWAGVKEGLEGPLWPRAKEFFPYLARLEQQVHDWEKLDFFSESGQGVGLVALLPSLKEAVDAVHRALTTFPEQITGNLDSRFKDVESQLRSLRSRLVPVWWQGILLALALGILLGVLFQQFGQRLDQQVGVLGRQLEGADNRSQQLEERIGALQTQNVALSSKLENIEGILLAPEPTPTPVVTATAEATSTLPLSPAVTLDWTRGISLYAAPSVTLTATPGWTFAGLQRDGDVESAAASSEVVALDAGEAVWHIAVMLYDSQDHTVPLTGTLTWKDEHLLLWQPPSSSLFAGEYRVEVQLKHNTEKHSIQGGSLSIAPRYGASHAQLRVYDAGVRGMSVIYRITNTGNITDSFGLTLYNQEPARPLTEVTGVLTLTTGVTQALSSVTTAAGEKLLTFTSPPSGTQTSPQSFYVLLPFLGPGQTLDIDLTILVNNGCPSVKIEVIPQGGKGTPYEIKEDFNGCQ